MLTPALLTCLWTSPLNGIILTRSALFLSLTTEFYANLTTCLIMDTVTTQRKISDTIDETLTLYCMGEHCFTYSLINKYLLSAY